MKGKADVHLLWPFQKKLIFQLSCTCLYTFYPIFHCSLYCRAVSIRDNLFTKQGNLRYVSTNLRFWLHCDIRVKQQGRQGKWLSNYFHRSLFFIVFLLIKRDEKGALVSKRSKQSNRGYSIKFPRLGLEFSNNNNLRKKKGWKFICSTLKV